METFWPWKRREKKVREKIRITSPDPLETENQKEKKISYQVNPSHYEASCVNSDAMDNRLTHSTESRLTTTRCVLCVCVCVSRARKCRKTKSKKSTKKNQK